MAGCSICWFNTVCYVLCIKNFPANRSLALSLSISFNGISAAFYTLTANAIDSKDETLYLLLNAVVPLITSVAALIPVLNHQSSPQAISADAGRHDSVIFLLLNIIAAFTGLYLLLLNSVSTNALITRTLLVGAILLLVLPLVMPGIVYAREWLLQAIRSSFGTEGLSFSLVDTDELELHKDLTESETPSTCRISNGTPFSTKGKAGRCCTLFRKNRLKVLGEEHPAWLLVRRWDFWLYYVAYFCGGTIGVVYSNNIGQIAESLGYGKQTSTIVTIYSTSSFFGRLLSSAPDFLRYKVYLARTGWFALAIVPVPIALMWLASSGYRTALSVGTTLIGLSSGFMFSTAVSLTSELFGPNSAGVNHNILITNIPLGSLFYGLVAAVVYDANAGKLNEVTLTEDSMVCMGRKCYYKTFLWWGCFSMFGLACSLLLFIRTRTAYDCYERNRYQMQLSECMNTISTDEN